MPYYKTLDSAVHFLDSAEFSYLLPQGSTEITEEEAMSLSPQPEIIHAPLVVSAWQIRKALNATALRESVEVAISQADQDTKDAWEYAASFERDHPLVLSLGAALEKTDTELDALFGLAASL